MRSFLAAFAIAAIVSAVLTPLVRLLALRLGAVSAVGGRNVNERQIPRLGGLAMCLALFAPIVGLFFVNWGVADLFQSQVAKVVGLCGGGFFMCMVGVVDDTRGMRALYKLGAQVAVAVFAFMCGFRIEAISLPLVGELSMGVFALPVTMLWIVGIINALNLIDGLDGLAGGVAFFAGVTNLVVAYIAGQSFTVLVMASLLGAILGFLFYNFNPARIFMGDSGSYLLGYVLAVTALAGAAQKTSTAVALLVPVVALGVPIFDTLFAMVRRFLERRPIFSPDRGHLHHKLLDLGITHRSAVLILYAVSVVFTIASIGIYLGRSWQIGIALLLACVVVVGLVRFVGVFSQMHQATRQKARMRSADTEHLRHALPLVFERFAAASSEPKLLKALAQWGREAKIAQLKIWRHGSEDLCFEWSDERQGRRVLAVMDYPLGPDTRARCSLTIKVENDAEQTRMEPQTDILLQVVADVLARELTRLGSEFAPTPVPAAREDESEEEAAPLSRPSDATPLLAGE